MNPERVPYHPARAPGPEITDPLGHLRPLPRSRIGCRCAGHAWPRLRRGAQAAREGVSLALGAWRSASTILRVLYLFDTTDRAESESVIEMARRGIEATVVCHPNAPMRERLETAGLEVIPLALRSKADPRAIAALRELRRARAFDIVHAYYKIALTNYNLAAVGLPRVPVVAYRGIVGNLSYWDPFSWLSFLDPRIERLVCVCEAIRQYFLGKRLLPGVRMIQPERVTTIHKGHRPEWYQHSDARIPDDLGVPGSAPLIGCVARLKKRKGIIELIRAFERLPAELDAHLLLIGNVEHNAIHRAVARSPVAERIRLTGYRKDAAQIAGALDVQVLPSLRREGLPRAIIEGMAQEIPVIVSDAGGNPELVSDGINGRVIPAGEVEPLREALHELLNNPHLRARMGAAGLAQLRAAFPLELTVMQTIELYHELIASSSRAGLCS